MLDPPVGGLGFPESGGAFFLEFGMRGKILKGKNVVSGESDDGIGVAGGGEFAESAEDREEFFGGAIVVDYEDDGTLGGALEQH